MSSIQDIPLDELIQQCSQHLVSLSPNGHELSELIRRAVQDCNDAAWDGLVTLLRPRILGWLYSATLDVHPANAEQVLFLSLNYFRDRCLSTEYSFSKLTNHAILDLLQQSVIITVEEESQQG